MGPSEARRPTSLLAAVILTAATAASVGVAWGFTVDDAWIPARVAANLEAGEGYRFNASGEITDAVTPLGWAVVLMPFAKAGLVGAFTFARWSGAAAWVIAAGALAFAAARDGQQWQRFLPLALLPVSLPLAAWASSGMETGWVMALCTLALRPTLIGMLAAGLAAGWRPELIPWSCTLVAVRAWRVDRVGPLQAPSPRWPALAVALACALGPAVVVALIRAAVFGRAAPLSVLAKPSEASSGVFYAVGAAIWTGAPALLFARGFWKTLPRRYLAPFFAGLAHWLAMVLAGGDWMAFYRLATPALPGLVFTGTAVAERTSSKATLVRVAVAVAISAFLYVERVDGARQIVAQREALIEGLRPLVENARRVASVDVGWVGASFPGTVIDLAGVTDERIAVLPGGHTSKRLPADLLDRWDVDVLVLLLAPGETPHEPWQRSRFARTVEARVSRMAAQTSFRSAGTLQLRNTEQSYLVVRR